MRRTHVVQVERKFMMAAVGNSLNFRSFRRKTTSKANKRKSKKVKTRDETKINITDKRDENLGFV